MKKKLSETSLNNINYYIYLAAFFKKKKKNLAASIVLVDLFSLSP